jgi:hypothetical protein
MKNYISDYRKEIEEKIKKDIVTKDDVIELEKKIAFFQHERLIHLLVTLAFALFTIIFLALGMISYIFLLPFFALIIFLIFYIFHYFFLENNVQYLYKIYDKVKKII